MARLSSTYLLVMELRHVAMLVVAMVLATIAMTQAAPSTGTSTTPASSSSTTSSPSASLNSIEDPLSTLAPAALKVLRECLSKEYSASACWKLFIVRRADGFISELRASDQAAPARPGVERVELLPGMVALERDARRQDDADVELEGVGDPQAKEDGDVGDLPEQLDPGRDQESLDRALLSRTVRLFNGRHLAVRVMPGVALKVSPRVAKDQNSVNADISVELGPGFSVGRMKMKNMSPIFLLPPLMFMGVLPFALATIKGMVIKAMMLNQIAFTSTLWMTVRDMVFGPRPIVKYQNYGYKPARPHFRHPPPSPPHFEQNFDHEVHHSSNNKHHSQPEHFEHHHEEHHLEPEHHIEHHVEHHETHGASPYFHEESSNHGDDSISHFNSAFQPQDYGGQDISSSYGHHDIAHSKQGDDLGEEEEDEPSPLPHASAYRRPQSPQSPIRIHSRFT